MSRCTLELGGTVLVVADDGTLASEYALFDPGDIELSATGPGTIRESGYRTTVGEALPRLAHFGLTRELAEEAAAAAKAWIARAYARGPAVRRIVEQLDAAELFDGRTYDPVSEYYAGAWLDLPGLVTDLSDSMAPARAASTLQAIHLAAVLAERSGDEPLTLGTVEVTAQRRPGERTFKRVPLEEPQALIGALRALKRPRRDGPETGPGRQEIVTFLRARAQRVPAAASRFAAIEAALCARDAPSRGPLVDADLWALETKLSLGETDGVVERLVAIERRRGRLPATAYLRARVALMAGTEEPRGIAERVSALSTSMSAFHELQLLAAQAWAAAGEVRQAHAFARDLVEDSTACDALRMRAREVLDATGRATTAPEGGIPLIPKPPLTPSLTGLESAGSSQIGGYTLLLSRDNEQPHGESVPLAIDLSLPVLVIEARTDRSTSTGREAEAEPVESLSLPPGMQDDPPPHDEAPRTPPAARLLCTYLARELGRELRMRHGLELRSDVEGLELAQRYLCETVREDRVRTTGEEREVMRHGAFLSELLARRMLARWADLESLDPNRWAMIVPSRSHPEETCRVWPFRRVLRFIAQRHKERDLVSYYFQLEARCTP